jgi:arginyl-tRNA synthetase
MKTEEQLKEIIWQSLSADLIENLSKDMIRLEKPANPEFGDWSTNIAMAFFPRVKEDFYSPKEFAQDLIKKIKSNDQNQIITNIDIAGPGFINFKLENKELFSSLKKIISGERILKDLAKQKKVIVEYSSPNIAKPFTIGHFRSTIIGDAMARILEASGYQVFRDNHLGDWGTQFGKQIVAIKKWGNPDEIEKSDNPVEKLVALYVKFHQEAEKDEALVEEGRAWFKKLENGDKEARELWQKCIDWSFKEFDRIYQRLGVKFTENDGRGYGESYFEDKLTQLIAELKEKGLAQEGKEGAYLIFFEDDKYPPLMIQKADGATLYATRDLATDKWRKENPRYQNEDGSPAIIVNEVGAEQALYFKQIYEVEKLLGWYKQEERFHLKHGLYRFKEGKMSTRKGNVIWLNDVLDKAESKAAQLTDQTEVAKKVSIAALKWNDLKRKAELAINFEWDEILNLQGNSGPYMLYSYARAKSVLTKAEEMEALKRFMDGDFLVDDDVSKSSSEIIPNDEEKEILSLLDDYAGVVERAASEYAPHHIANYLFKLAQAFNSFYNKHQILKNSAERQFRLQLTYAVSVIIKEGLSLLGIETLERM